LVYILPLVFLLLGATLAGRFSDSDLYAATGGGIGVALGFLLAKWGSSRFSAHTAPYIARKA
jgi:positive regulator of sigma E activity